MQRNYIIFPIDGFQKKLITPTYLTKKQLKWVHKCENDMGAPN